MKRSLVLALIVGFAVAGAIAVLQITEVLVRIEIPVRDFIAQHHTINRSLGATWQYVLMAILAVGIAWLTVTTSRRGQLGWVVLALVVELGVFAWICSLYHVFFQPIPSILAVGVAFVVSERFLAIYQRSGARVARTLLGERLSKKQLQRVIAGEIPFDAKPRAIETSVIVADIANKYELADENDPAVYAETTEAFIRRATEHFLEAGAYIQAADGEGVVALFGFPGGEPDHADKAVRMSLGLVEAFQDFRLVNNGEAPSKCDVHVGISSGTMIAAPFKNDSQPGLLTTGEPVELARRFCVANRFYGSRILIGPRTFELASKHVVARPIDFLSGVNSQERHEIFEPLCLATEAKPENIARRDSFWNGVVLYREKRWAEAYSEFQKARGPSDEEEDAPLQLYLRRLEVLALHLAEAPENK